MTAAGDEAMHERLSNVLAPVHRQVAFIWAPDHANVAAGLARVIPSGGRLGFRSHRDGDSVRAPRRCLTTFGRRR